MAGVMTVVQVKLTAFALPVLMILAAIFSGLATASVTTDESIVNGFPSTDLKVHCTSLSVDMGAQTVKPGATWRFSVTSTLEDPSVTCEVATADPAAMATTQTLVVWNYARSGYSDAPWYNCSSPSGCTWKLQQDGAYYRTAATGEYALYSAWA
jgi:hypothetical protein